MKIIITHASPDWDAIASVWVIKRFLPGWQHATVEFVAPGERSDRVKQYQAFETDVVALIGEDEIIHVDTGVGPLDHHQDMNDTTSAAMKSWEYVRKNVLDAGDHFSENHEESLTRMMKVIVDYDHFKEIFFPDPNSDHHDFSLSGLLDGMKLQKQGQDQYLVDFGTECLNSMFQRIENKVWTEHELEENGVPFETKYGKGIGLETSNHAVLKYGQRLGYVLVIRKDPRNGYLAIASRPARDDEKKLDLTMLHEQLKKMDPEATWYFHVSKQILLNGNTKSASMRPTKLSLEEIVSAARNIYS